MSVVKRYNPEEKPPLQWRGLLLYFLPLPLLPAIVGSLLRGDTQQTLARTVAFVLTMVAATLIRKGIRLDAEALRRRLRRRASTVPYRFVGAMCLTAGMFVLSWLGINQHGLVDSLLFSLAVLVGCYLYYDFDFGRKHADIAAVGITTEELLELLDEAEGRISAIERASKDIRNVEFRDRLKRIVKEARVILDTIEKDPVDARRARKFLKVYLDGAMQVTEGYARMHVNDDTPALEENFRRVLTTIETVISEQQEKLNENNVSELDVQIEVLQLQLEKEGVV